MYDYENALEQCQKEIRRLRAAIRGLEDEKAKLKNPTEIDFGETKLVASLNCDDGYKEVCVYLEKDGCVYQDIAVIGIEGEYKGEIICRVYSDENDEDYTHSFSIKEYKED